jgi:hypothetical protein
MCAFVKPGGSKVLVLVYFFIKQRSLSERLRTCHININMGCKTSWHTIDVQEVLLLHKTQGMDLMCAMVATASYRYWNNLGVIVH